MQQFSFTPGQPVRLFKTLHFVQNVHNDVITLRNADNNTTRDYELSTLLGHYQARNLKAEKPPRSLKPVRQHRLRRTLPLIADASDAAQTRGKQTYAYLQAIANSGVPFRRNDAGLQEVLCEVARERGETEPPSFSALSRARSRFVRSGGDPAACLPRYDLRGGAGKSRLSAAVEAGIQAAIDNHYMTTEAASISEVYEGFRAALIEELRLDDGFTEDLLPSYSTFRRRVLDRGSYELYAARNGARAAEKAFRHSQPPTARPGFNDVWEIDHTRLDLLVVDPRRGFSARRPRLTVILDACTRAVMGFDVDFTGDSSQAVLNALRHAISPKDYVGKRYPDVKCSWPCHGTPITLRCDNGVEFHSKSVKRACAELNISLEYCPLRRPTAKGGVERFFRTLSEGLLRKLPGYAGPDLKRRKDLEDVNLPVIDLETFMRLLHIWVIDVYMNAGCGAKGQA